MKSQVEGYEKIAMKKHMLYQGMRVTVICGGADDWWLVQRDDQYVPFVVHKNELVEIKEK